MRSNNFHPRKGERMSKLSAKNAVVLANGYNISTFATAYEATQDVTPLDVTAFSEGFKNNVPGIVMSKINCTLFWDSAAGGTHDALGALSNGCMTILPEGYYLGAPSISMPYMQADYSPKGQVDGVIEVGAVNFENYGTSNGVEYGVVLAHATITNTATGSSVLDPTNAAVTAACSATLHIWDATATDTYEIIVQHSADNSTWATLATFSMDGTALGAERITVASGTINKYRRAKATRTGSAGDSFGYTVHFFHS
jgi:hypothetical protein